MDFEYTVKEYTPELEEFRKEVKRWLKENGPPDHIQAPKGDPEDVEEYQHRIWDWTADFRKKLGAKRWLYPAMPYKYGGGGLTADHAAVIREELQRLFPSRIMGWPVMHSVDLIFGPLFVWATDEQRERFLPGILSGQTITMQTFTEPHGGSDLANVKSTAVRDGDAWVLNGQRIFCTGYARYTKLLFGPFLTDPDSPRHRNLGFFLIPRETPGVTLIPLRLLSGTHTNIVLYDNVRIPAGNMIGGDHQGWQVAQTLLEAEHGGAPTQGAGPMQDSDYGHLSQFIRSTNSAKHPLATDPSVQERIADVYIESHISTLWGLRNFSQYRANNELSYEGSQSSVFSRESGLRRAERMRAVIGPHTLLSHHDPLTRFEGLLERGQRGAIPCGGGGSTEVHKVIIARRLGMSRTQEAAAPTAGLAIGSPR